MAQLDVTLDTELLHGLFSKDNRDDSFSKLLEAILNQVLLAQSTEQLGAAPYERCEERSAYRNGFRDREFTTRVGSLTLRIPRHRNGNFSTSLFERYQRSEQALVLAMIEMVINGVSTRKIEHITEELCGKPFSKSLVSDLCKKLDPAVYAFQNRPLSGEYPFLCADAIYIKVREEDRVKSKSLLIATGVNREGYREIVGFYLSESESETSWDEFFTELIQRGLATPRLVTSDHHKGLVKAVRKRFPGSSRQRCQTHFSRNVLDKTPKTRQPQVKEDLRRVCEAVDMDSARQAKNDLLGKYSAKAAKAMDLMDESFDDITAVLSLPLRYRKRLRTTNGIERLNQEIRRRERVIRIFPNDASALRLMGQDEKWTTGRKYFDRDVYYDSVVTQENSDEQVA